MSLTRIEKDRLCKLIAKHCADAETQSKALLSAPEACCIIEILTVLAACTKDPSLRTGAVDEKFNYLRTPDSYKACLYQVINETCDAFRKSHNAMSKIELHLEDIPITMSDIMEAMQDLKNEDTKATITYSVASLGKISTKCQESAKEALSGCDRALEVIKELSQAVITVQSTNDHALDDAKKQIEIQEMIKRQHEAELSELKELLESQKQVAQDAMKQYKTQLDESTNIGNMFLLTLMDKVSDVIDVLSQQAKSYAQFNNLPADLMSNAKGQLAQFTKDKLINKGIEKAMVSTLKNFTGTDPSTLVAEIDSFKKTFESALSHAPSTEIGKMAAEKMSKISNFLSEVKAGGNEWKSKLEPLKKDVQPLIDACDKDCDSKQQEQDIERAGIPSQEKQSLVKIKQDQLKLAQEQMEIERKRSDALRKEKNEASKQLNETIIKLQQLNVERLELRDIIAYLKEGIEQLGKLQVSWRQVVAFFDYINVIVDGPFMTCISNFTDQTNAALQSGSYVKKLMSRNVMDACAVSCVLKETAKLYKIISTEHVMPILDRSILNIALDKAQAQQLKVDIQNNYNRIRDSVQATIDNYATTMSKNVYDEMADQGFDVKPLIAKEKKAIGQ